jgi:DNA polymerase I-like protein with 3'-5' exonuclease and polymerase domains
MKQPKPITIDFETFGIDKRPAYPPEPVGVSIKLPGQKARYYSWGHPTKNNCTEAQALKALKKVWWNPEGILFQNGKFDIDVAEEHLLLAPPAWDKIHDTMFLLFLDDPHQQNLSLKPSSERLLKMKPEEQDAVGEWLIKNQPIDGVKISTSKKSDHYFGRYIAYAPGDLVGKYANGDVIRTEKLFNLLWKKTKKRNMLEAYDRERRLMPILLEMERQGVPVNLKQLRADVKMYNIWRDKLQAWIIKRLNAEPDINLNSGQQLMKALLAAGKVDIENAVLTPTGKFKTTKDAIAANVTDKVLVGVLKYVTQLNTCLNTFMEPWLKIAEQSKGLIYTQWNQTKQVHGGSNIGTRTGRLSSTPNFQNIPKVFDEIFHHENRKAKLPKCPFKGLPGLPKIRTYIIPFKNEVLLDRDYSQQELRILAHFDGGTLMDAYLDNKWVDVHDHARSELAEMGLVYERKLVKNTNFGIIYGMGNGALAIKNGTSVEEAKKLKAAILSLYAGLKEMYSEMKVRAKAKIPITTWGGREYYCEEPKLVQGRVRHFDYKLVNVLIQGSAADCTKEAIIIYHGQKHPKAKILLNVHDQITTSVPKSIAKKEMEVLRVCMESLEFDVPMLSEGKTSTENWGSLESYDKQGVIL